MATITKTTNTFSTPEAPLLLTSPSQGSVRQLDLLNKEGAYIHCRIGRQTTAALTRAGYVAIRKTVNDGVNLQSTLFDSVTQTAASINTTLSASTSIGDSTISVTSATSFVVGDVLYLGSGASRVEFCRIASISGTTFTLERALRVAHTSGDAVTSMADVQTIWIPGGDRYEIRAINNSGQSLVFAIDAEVENGYTST